MATTMAGRMLLLVLLAVAGLLSVSMAEHEVLAAKGISDEHDDNVYRVSKGGQGSLKSYQCSPACSRRCGNTQYKKPCLFYCNKCCNTCLCVPSGYYGNKAECPCYNNWKTKRGGTKVPLIESLNKARTPVHHEQHHSLDTNSIQSIQDKIGGFARQ